MVAKILRNLSTRETGDSHGSRDTDTLNPEAWRESIRTWFSFSIANPPRKQHVVER